MERVDMERAEKLRAIQERQRKFVDTVIAVGILILSILFFLLYLGIEDGWAQESRILITPSEELREMMEKELLPPIEEQFKKMELSSDCTKSQFHIMVVPPNMTISVVMECIDGKENHGDKVRFLPSIHSRRRKTRVVQRARHERRTRQLHPLPQPPRERVSGLLG